MPRGPVAADPAGLEQLAPRPARGRRWRAGWRRRALSPSRVKAIIRRSGPARELEAAALGDPAPRADERQVRAALPGGDQVRVPVREQRLDARRARGCCGSSGRGGGRRAQAVARRSAQRGGHSCSSATSQSASASTDSKAPTRSAFTCAWAAPRSVVRSSRERQVKQLGLRRMVATVEQVPGEGSDLHRGDYRRGPGGSEPPRPGRGRPRSRGGRSKVPRFDERHRQAATSSPARRSPTGSTTCSTGRRS